MHPREAKTLTRTEQPVRQRDEENCGMKRLLGLLAIIAMSSTACAADLFFPDPKDTPGAMSPEVTQANILETVCQSAWLEKIRPSGSYIDELKAKQIEALQLNGGPTDYQEDH